MGLKFGMLHLLVWNVAFSIHMILSKLRKRSHMKLLKAKTPNMTDGRAST